MGWNLLYLEFKEADDDVCSSCLTASRARTLRGKWKAAKPEKSSNDRLKDVMINMCCDIMM